MKPRFETKSGEGEVPSPEQLKGRAFALLGRREHTRTELRRKLEEKGGQQEQIEPLLDELVERRFQSDERFAEMYVRSRAERGYGPLVIRQELKEKGVSAELITQAMDASAYDWDEQALQARVKRFGPDLPREPKEKARQFRFLQYRGFSGQQLKQAFQGGSANACDD